MSEGFLTVGKTEIKYLHLYASGNGVAHVQ